MAHPRMAEVERPAERPEGRGAAPGALATLAPATHAVLRIGAAALFTQHGAQKLFGWLGGLGGTPGETAPLVSLMGLAGTLEFFGGLLVLLGLLTRAVALILAAEMGVAYAIAHLPRGGWPIENQGELALLYAAVFLFLAGNGSGPASLDRQWRLDPGPAA
ncbi:MAG: DoxX family protein [Candidatus Methylomirabilales bacterium]